MPSSKPASEPTSEPTRQHKAGLLDIRNIIGGLLTAYGVILTLTGLFGDQGGDNTGDVNANLWAGLILIVGGAAFLIWAKVRPVVVPERHGDHQDADG